MKKKEKSMTERDRIVELYRIQTRYYLIALLMVTIPIILAVIKAVF
jgi:hypothetical protein